MTSTVTVVPIGRTGRVALVHDWAERRAACPHVDIVVREALSSPNHEYLYRGDQRIERPERLFLVGEKARPLRHDGDASRLDRGSAERLAEDEPKFRDLAGAYLGTGMARRRGVATPTLDEAVEFWRQGRPADRYAIALVLLAALHHQNSRREAQAWREYLWFLSCTRSDSVALKYAIGSRDAAPASTYVIEYAPPKELVMSVAQFANLIDRLRLGTAFPDLDSEVFAMNALLPHYIVGYTVLRRRPGEEVQYGSEFIPNPHYSQPGASIRYPPDLNDAQREVFRDTRETLAWVETRGGQWATVYDPRGPRRLGPEPDARAHD